MCVWQREIGREAKTKGNEKFYKLEKTNETKTGGLDQEERGDREMYCCRGRPASSPRRKDLHSLHDKV